MATAEIVREKALSLALADTSIKDAVQELLDCCGDRRVPLVLARQRLLKGREAAELDPVMSRAIEFLDETLQQLPPEG